VVLRALLIHHFNYIRFAHSDKVQPGVWTAFGGLLSLEDSIELLVTEIKTIQLPQNDLPSITIGRLAGHSLMATGRGNTGQSIIGQLSQVISKLPPHALMARAPPWVVHFEGETATADTELLTEAALSIFHPTSKLVQPTPDLGHRFVPGCQQLDVLFCVGVLIGIIIRHKLPQDLPFAPLVWRFLAGERLGEADVVEVDPYLKTLFKGLRDGTIGATWIIRQWDGDLVPVPGHSGEAVERCDVNHFIGVMVDFRLRALRPGLKAIRRGFRANTMLRKREFVTGMVLSRAGRVSKTDAVPSPASPPSAGRIDDLVRTGKSFIAAAYPRVQTFFSRL
jgi:hypothetical protein